MDDIVGFLPGGESDTDTRDSGDDAERLEGGRDRMGDRAIEKHLGVAFNQSTSAGRVKLQRFRAADVAEELDADDGTLLRIFGELGTAFATIARGMLRLSKGIDECWMLPRAPRGPVLQQATGWRGVRIDQRSTS